MIWQLMDLLEYARNNQTSHDGQYIPARPMRLLVNRWKAAWLVLRDRADVVVWPGNQ
jgi:hypothetical protein